MRSNLSSNRELDSGTPFGDFRVPSLQGFSGVQIVDHGFGHRAIRRQLSLRGCRAYATVVHFRSRYKTKVLDLAPHPIKAVFAQCFDPYHADSTENWPHSTSAVRIMHGDTKGAFPDLTWHKCGVRQTVEPVTAQIVSHGLHTLGSAGPNETNRPVDLHSGTSSTLPYSRIDFVNRVWVEVGWKTVDRFRQHKVPAPESIFRAINKVDQNIWQILSWMPITCMNSQCFSPSLQIAPKVLKSCRSSSSTGPCTP